jgi:hypothetical protein
MNLKIKLIELLISRLKGLGACRVRAMART